ncbi:MAG: methionyl-tRNA formyltransferase [Sphingomonadales bacterium]
MRLAFMGTPAFAVPALDAVLEAGHEVVAVYTQPPRRSGRGKKQTPTPVAGAAAQIGLDIFTPVDLDDDQVLAKFRELNLDAAVVAAYGLILPAAFLEAPGLGCINIHASLLPRWRGAAPVQRAILAGDTRTGVSIMRMAQGLDTGAVLLKGEMTIEEDDTAATLTDDLARLGARLMVDALDGLAAGSLRAEPQSESGVTYAKKIRKSEARIDWAAPAETVARQVRAFNPDPGAWFVAAGERIKVLQGSVMPVGDGQTAGDGKTPGRPQALSPGPAKDSPPGMVLDDMLSVACGSGAYRINRAQRPGRGELTSDVLLRGFPIPAGSLLAVAGPAAGTDSAKSTKARVEAIEPGPD